MLWTYLLVFFLFEDGNLLGDVVWRWLAMNKSRGSGSAVGLVVETCNSGDVVAWKVQVAKASRSSNLKERSLGCGKWEKVAGEGEALSLRKCATKSLRPPPDSSCLVTSMQRVLEVKLLPTRQPARALETKGEILSVEVTLVSIDMYTAPVLKFVQVSPSSIQVCDPRCLCHLNDPQPPQCWAVLSPYPNS